MNTFEKLIAQFCPNGVEYKPLGEVCDILRGMRLTKSQLSNENSIPVFHGGISPIGYYDTPNREANTVVVINVGASAGTVGFISVPFWSSDGCFCLKHDRDLDSKYLYYVLKAYESKITAKIRVAGIPTLDASVIKKLIIPIPPLPVQKEIVRMLDDMAGLIDALEGELAARKKQYEWSRERLLTFGDDVERKTLGNIAEISRGGSLQKRDFTETGIPCIHYGQIYTRFGVWADKPLTYTSSEGATGQKFAKVGDIVMAVTSETVEDVCKCVAWVGDAPAVVSGHTAIIHHNQNPKYLSYYFHTSQFATQKRHLAHGVKVIEVTPERLKNIIIPCPPIDEQNEIVRRLDDITSLIAALEEELALRKQQYEYYRDKLLAFKRKPEVA